MTNFIKRISFPLLFFLVFLSFPQFASAQQLNWVKQFGSSAIDNGSGIVTDTDGNVYISGSTQGAFPGQLFSGYNNLFIKKSDKDGNEIWTKEFVIGSSATGGALAIDQQNDLLTPKKT